MDGLFCGGMIVDFGVGCLWLSVLVVFFVVGVLLVVIMAGCRDIHFDGGD